MALPLVGLGLGIGGGLLGAYMGTSRDTNISGLEDRRKRLLGYGSEAGGREAAQMGTAASIGQMGGLYDELAAQRATAGERSQMQARGAAESAGRDIRGMMAGAGPQNQAFALRKGLQGIGGVRMGEARMAREGELAEIDAINRQRQALLASKGGLEADVFGRQLSSEQEQRRLNQQMQQYAMGAEADEAYRQAQLTAGAPTQGEQMASMFGGLGSALMMSSGRSGGRSSGKK